nr:GntR family transcriptional regulator [Flexivirga meconopsidis]
MRAEVERMLSAAIVAGELAPGIVVSVPELAARFGVSATPVREAMLNLENRGFVSSVRNKGFRVTPVGEDDLQELVQVRCWLEVPAARLAAADFPMDQMDRFRALADDIVQTAAAADFADYLAADTAFHLALIELTGNTRLRNVVADLRSQTRLVGLASLKDTKELKRSAAEHHLMLDLLADGKADEVAELMETHIGHVVGWWAGRSETD